MESKEKSGFEFRVPQCMCDFGFLVDITGHLDELNCRLQGKGQLIHTLNHSIKGLQTKLVLCERQLTANNYYHFLTLRRQMELGRILPRNVLTAVGL
jgi:hypothetical protein